MLFFLLVTSITFAQENSVNYLKTDSIIKFDNNYYNLAWSSHPNDIYYKQKYLTKDENLDRFQTLITIDFIKGNFEIKDLVNKKLKELEELKKNNPIINYKIYENGDEMILDFLVSQNSQDGKKILIIERNLYRYTVAKDDKDKTNGILLFGVSKRAYGDEIEKFFNELKQNNTDLINQVGSFEIPTVQI